MSSEEVIHLPLKTQDYLKHIWDIQEHTGKKAQVKEIASRVGEKISTASEAIKRLNEKGFLVHEKYLGVELTPMGAAYAVALVRRHRLIETFLVEVLGYTWDEVHDDAELLEHSISDKLLERIDAYLNYPNRDPHGDPIPTADGDVISVSTMNLADCPLGEKVIVDRILDHEPGVLRYLGENNIIPGASLIKTALPMPGLIHIRRDGEEQEIVLPVDAAKLIAVQHQ